MKFQVKNHLIGKNGNKIFTPTDYHAKTFSSGHLPLTGENSRSLFFKKLSVKTLLLWIALFFTFNISAQEYYTQSNSDNTFHFLDQVYRLTYTGSYRDFKVPAEASGKILYLYARGGDGGTVHMANGSDHGRGGQGAAVEGYFKIGAGTKEIPVGSTIRFVIGGAGGSATSTAFQISHHAGGGGGGTGILFLPPGKDPIMTGKSDWTLLMVAGGGGGAYAKWGTATRYGERGRSGELPGYSSDPSWYTDLLI